MTNNFNNNNVKNNIWENNVPKVLLYNIGNTWSTDSPKTN